MEEPLTVLKSCRTKMPYFNTLCIVPRAYKPLIVLTIGISVAAGMKLTMVFPLVARRQRKRYCWATLILWPTKASSTCMFPLQQEPSEDDPLTKKRSNHLQRKLAGRKPNAKVDPHVEEQFLTGRVYGTFCNVEAQWWCFCANAFVSIILFSESTHSFLMTSLILSLCFLCSLCGVQTRPEWSVWWLHPWGKGAGILPEEAQIKKSKITFSIDVVACYCYVVPLWCTDLKCDQEIQDLILRLCTRSN